MELFLHIFFHIELIIFLAKNFFAVEIKKCPCSRSKKFCSIKYFPEWKTALKFPYDSNITLRMFIYIFKKYSFFNKTSEKDDTPLKLPRLQINNYNTGRIPSIKFLGLLLDENLLWKYHIKYSENKFSKNIGISYKVRDYFSQQSLLSLYYAYILTYVNYANLAWTITIRTNLTKIHRQEKHVICIIFYKDFHTIKAFLYRTNILKNLNFMRKVKTETTPALFIPKSQKPAHP